jgi:hypothetical protein
MIKNIWKCIITIFLGKFDESIKVKEKPEDDSETKNDLNKSEKDFTKISNHRSGDDPRRNQQFSKRVFICRECSNRNNRKTKTLHILKRNFWNDIVWECVHTNRHRN